MSEDPTDSTAKHAVATMSFFHLMGYFASPRIVDKVKEMPTREHLLEHIREYLKIVDLARACPDAPGNKSTLATELHARRLHELRR